MSSARLMFRFRRLEAKTNTKRRLRRDGERPSIDVLLAGIYQEKIADLFPHFRSETPPCRGGASRNSVRPQPTRPLRHGYDDLR
jgi:hypothetical protein